MKSKIQEHQKKALTVRKRLFLMATVVLSLWSCSSDDDNAYYPTPVTGTPVPSKVTMTNNEDNSQSFYAITYDDQKHISKIVKTGAQNRTFLFTYNADDQVATIAITGFEPELWAFSYDAFMRLETVSNNGSPAAITFDTATQTYAFGSTHFKLNDNGDMSGAAFYLFNYDAAKKGAFASVNASYHVLGLLVDGFFLQCCTKSAFTTWSVNGNPAILYTNTYDTDGYVTESITSGLFNETIQYDYIRI